MRAFILALALGLPFALAGCAESPQEEAIEEGAPPGDMEDVIGDGEIIDEPGEPEGDMMMDGDLFVGYDTDGDGMLSQAEYDAGMADGNMAAYDTDGDGMVSRAEYDAYMDANPAP